MDFFDEESKVIVTVINSYPCAIKSGELRQLKILYDNAEKLNKIAYKELIAEFIFSYKISLHTKEYKEKLGKNYEEYKNNLYEIFAKSEFGPNGNIYNDSINFYIKVINYGIENNINIYIEQKERILTKFYENQKDQKVYKEIFDKFIEQNKLLSQLIIYDYDINSHIGQYKRHILSAKENGYESEEALKIFEVLINSIKLDEEFIKKFINKYILLCNQTNREALQKNNNSLFIISNFEQTLKELNLLKK